MAALFWTNTYLNYSNKRQASIINNSGLASCHWLIFAMPAFYCFPQHWDPFFQRSGTSPKCTLISSQSHWRAIFLHELHSPSFPFMSALTVVHNKVLQTTLLEYHLVQPSPSEQCNSPFLLLQNPYFQVCADHSDSKFCSSTITLIPLSK